MPVMPKVAVGCRVVAGIAACFDRTRSNDEPEGNPPGSRAGPETRV